MKRLRVPAGHSVTLLARDLSTILLTCAGDGQVLALAPDGSNKRAVITGLQNVHGIALSGDRLLVATPTRVYEATWSESAAKLPPRPLITDLPGGGQHPNRTLAFGPDGQLYISVGSTCNACEEPDPEHATMLKATPDGKSRTVFAKGLRNTIGFGWHPQTRERWGMDHSSRSERAVPRAERR